MLIWIPLIPILIIVAKLATRYLIQQETTETRTTFDSDRLSTDTSWLSSPEGKAEMMRQQVIAKIHWGARDQEVYEWLQERHGISGREADELLAQAHRAKRKQVRIKASIMLVVSGCSVLFGGVYLVLRFKYNVTLPVWISEGVDFIGCISLLAFLRSVWLLLTGKMDGSVD